MAKNSNFKLEEPKVIFSGTIVTPNGNDYVSITTAITNINNSEIKNGFFIKNISDVGNYFDVKHNSLNHGSNTGYVKILMIFILNQKKIQLYLINW